MGTRAVVRFMGRHGQPTVYRGTDGYPSGVGYDLWRFLDSKDPRRDGLDTGRVAAEWLVTEEIHDSRPRVVDHTEETVEYEYEVSVVEGDWHVAYWHRRQWPDCDGSPVERSLHHLTREQASRARRRMIELAGAVA